ncbi:GerAB/ArcD/ProY family transporter [Fictibacillus enclensis]|uniref:GerAB/ArcD/ProY family transporter n=1 Tax=Fictibacillus enclensis TaxID=1017270 RepID=UPI0025A0589E|nr:GerAB/ArcD/ProY family transporter [Fictibacillus enclensis]MDM5337662.1 GerAB/ArcD/ProY family transporter [Fictibacillus enclensis]
MCLPTFELMRAINIVKLLERIEVLVGVVWIVGIFVKIVLCFYAAMMGLQHVARHHRYRTFLLPAGLWVWASPIMNIPAQWNSRILLPKTGRFGG